MSKATGYFDKYGREVHVGDIVKGTCYGGTFIEKVEEHSGYFYPLDRPSKPNDKFFSFDNGVCEIIKRGDK